MLFFFFSSRRRHTRLQGDWSSDVCSSDLLRSAEERVGRVRRRPPGARSRRRVPRAGPRRTRLQPARRAAAAAARGRPGRAGARAREARMPGVRHPMLRIAPVSDEVYAVSDLLISALSGQRIWLFDLEATGLDTAKERVTQIAGCMFENG